MKIVMPGKKFKRKIVNKAKFSSRLSSTFLAPLTTYTFEDEQIEPLLYWDKKLAINITVAVDDQLLLHFLKKVLFPFDLYYSCKVPWKIKHGVAYLNSYYAQDLMLAPQQLSKYDYVWNISDKTFLSMMKPGFPEALFALSAKSSNPFFGLSHPHSMPSFQPHENQTFVTLLLNETSVSLEDLFYNDEIAIYKTFFFAPSILKQEQLSLLNKDSNDLLLQKFFLLAAERKIAFAHSFREIHYNKISLIKQYAITSEQFYEHLKDYNTISFDIFDTLITRTVYQPDDIFNLIEQEVGYKLPQSFIKMRKEAERFAVQTLKRDVDLHDIYQAMQEEFSFSSNDIARFKKLEIKMEQKHLIARKDMVTLYHHLLKEGKTIDLISDMYLPQDVVEQVLKQCGITGYRNLLLSCSLNKRKDTGEMWDDYYENNFEKTIHIGDNYFSDYLQVLKRGKPAIKILSGSDYLNANCIKPKTLEESLTCGIIYQQVLFNSPFFDRQQIENHLDTYGQFFLAPIFFTFFRWFEQVNTSDEILFVAREGYYLQKIYHYYCEKFQLLELPNVYFLTSRRAATVASCTNVEDFISLLDLEFNGTLEKLFENRYGIKITENKEQVVSLPSDKNEIRKIVEKYELELLEEAKKERLAYLSYIDKVCPNRKQKTLSILDLGYSGTIQYYLSKLLNLKIEGYYFAITKTLRPKKLDCKIEGCFNVDKAGNIDETNLFYRQALYLESFLSAPVGQLKKFNGSEPVFTDGTFNKQKEPYLDKIYEGVTKGFDAYAKMEEKNFSIDFINQHYQFLCKFLHKCDGKLAKVFYLDEDYCTNGDEPIDLLARNQ